MAFARARKRPSPSLSTDQQNSTVKLRVYLHTSLYMTKSVQVVGSEKEDSAIMGLSESSVAVWRRRLRKCGLKCAGTDHFCNLVEKYGFHRNAEHLASL